MGIFASGQRTTSSKLNALGNSGGISNALTADITTSATYEDLPTATASFSFTKLQTSTVLLASFDIVWYTTATATQAKFGLNINSVDYDVTALYINEANSYRQASGTKRITGVSAGSHTVQARWLRVTGSGTCTVSTDSWISILLVEAQ